MATFKETVLAYAKQDRQWLRALRLRHYKMQLAKCSKGDCAFWVALIKLNEDDS